MKREGKCPTMNETRSFPLSFSFKTCTIVGRPMGCQFRTSTLNYYRPQLINSDMASAKDTIFLGFTDALASHMASKMAVLPTAKQGCSSNQ